MCNADDTNAAFSPDAKAGIADFLPDGTSTSAVALEEMKLKCSQATLAEEMELIALYGEYQEINAEEDPMSLKHQSQTRRTDANCYMEWHLVVSMMPCMLWLH
jgi:hypothetical protein